MHISQFWSTEYFPSISCRDVIECLIRRPQIGHVQQLSNDAFEDAFDKEEDGDEDSAAPDVDGIRLWFGQVRVDQHTNLQKVAK